MDYTFNEIKERMQDVLLPDKYLGLLDPKSPEATGISTQVAYLKKLIADNYKPKLR